jgi:hypothetical protein
MVVLSKYAEVMGRIKVRYIPQWFLKLTLYGGGPFFCYPYKPFFNYLEGSDYERSYQHFRRDHSDNTNLGFHVLSLVFQLSSNYGLLHEIDLALGTTFATLEDSVANASAKQKEPTKSVGIIALLTTLSWTGFLLNTPAPTPVKLAASVCIFAAYRFRAVLADLLYSDSFFLFQGFLEVLAVRLVLMPGSIIGAQFAMPILGLRLALQQFATKNRGCLKSSKSTVNVCTLVSMAYLSANSAKNIGGPNPFCLGIIGWLLSLLTDQRWLHFYSCAYMASLTQGISHNLTGEVPTLTQLDSIADELAHTAYFPNLLLQSVYQSMRARAM